MRIARKATLAIGVGSAAAALIAGMATPAFADPAVKPPAVTDIAGVGSDTTQGVFQQLQTDYNVGKSSGRLASWDAFVPSTQADATNIVEKAGCPTVTRPAGSGAGIADLKTGNRPSGSTTAYCVDFARSSRAPGTADSGYGFVRLAQDAVTWSKTVRSGVPSNAPTSLSNTELRAIYTCNAGLVGGTANQPVRWNQVGGTSSDLVAPVLPQASSGTRSFFLGAIGVTTVGSCVSSTTPEENQGLAPSTLFAGSNSKNLIFPYSAAVYLAQSQNGKGTGNQGNQVLGSAENTSGTVISPTTGTAGALTINPALSTVGLTRFVYNVVRGTTIPTYLSSLLGTSGYLCTNTTAQNDIKAYGFRSIGSQCGTVQTA